MAEINTTVAAVMIPEVWGSRMVVSRESDYHMAKRVEKWDEDVASFGDTIHVPRISSLVAATLPITGNVQFSATTETEVQITLDQMKYIAFSITDVTNKQSKYNLRSAYTDKAGPALGKPIETGLMGLWSGFSTVLTAQPEFDEDFILSAVQELDVDNVPQSDRFCVSYVSQKRALLKVDKLVSNQYRSGNPGEQITKGLITLDIYGVEFSFSPLTVLSTTYKNLMFHRSAMALAVQKKVAVEKFARVGFHDDYAAFEIYGFGEVRDDHAVVMPTST